MARTKQRKVGDRIFVECSDGTIGTATIKKIEPAESPFDKKGYYLGNGKKYKFNYYRTSDTAVIEDYNCLSGNDPRVKEYCKGKKFITADFADELRQFLVEHNANKGDYDVIHILYDLAEEFGA
jgi:hypothetical protein